MKYLLVTKANPRGISDDGYSRYVTAQHFESPARAKEWLQDPDNKATYDACDEVFLVETTGETGPGVYRAEGNYLVTVLETAESHERHAPFNLAVFFEVAETKDIKFRVKSADVNLGDFADLVFSGGPLTEEE